MGLQEYLTYCKGALEKLLDFPAVHVVLGNEACDLDTTVSALTYAYYLHETSTASVGTVLFLPLLTIPRNEFRLRTEVVFFLGKYGISSEDLFFLDDVDLLQVKEATDLKITLVDHHVLSPSFSTLEDNVLQIIDHRPKDGNLPDRCESTLELVGSCCTLITDILLLDETFTMDDVTAVLLYGTILTDTANFSPSAGKTTPKDLEMVDRLELILLPAIDRDAVFEEISRAKFDLSGLTVKEILLKDLKIVAGDSLLVAMSSVTMDITEFSQQPHLMESLQSFVSSKHLDAVVVLTVAIDDGIVTRQLGIYSPSRVYREQMAEILQSCRSPSLALSPLASGHEEFLTFSQNNVKASRKQILPVVKSFLSGETTPDDNQSNVYDDLPRESREGFSSMSSIRDRPSSSEDEITPEDLISQGISSTLSQTPEDKLLTPLSGKVFDPLSSVHSSDSISSPSDFISELKKGMDDSVEKQLGASEEIDFDPFGNRNFNSSEVAIENTLWDEFRDDGSTGAGLTSSYAEMQDLLLSDSHDVLDHAAIQNPFVSNLVPVSAEQGLLSDAPFSASKQEILSSGSAFHNGADLVEQDFFNMASPHDLLFPTESPMDFSSTTTSGQVSGQTSGPESKTSSYPVTPPNSYMDSDFGIVTKEVNLPSFNSSEMVEKIKEKQASLGNGEPSISEPLSPFTPQNSYSVESGFASAYPKETQLPSFHSSDMVQRIQEKRVSMERELGAGSEFDTLLEVQKNPFTPHNSYVDADFDTFAREYLPSLNNAEIATKIQQRQVELDQMLADESASTSPGGQIEDDSPDGQFPAYSRPVMDLDKVLERLTSSDSGSSPDEALRTSSKVRFGSSSQLDADDEEDSAEKVMESSADSKMAEEEMEAAVQKIAFELANQMIQKALETFPSYMVQQLLPNSHIASQNEDLDAHVGTAGDSLDHSSSNDSLTESSEVGFAEDDLKPALSRLERQEEELHQQSSDFSESPPLHKSSSSRKVDFKNTKDFTIETEYLPEMDPLRNVYGREANVIGTDADKEVVESTIFRKISGQENQTVQEEILEQIRQEAREREQIRLRQSSVLEEDEKAFEEENDDDSEIKDEEFNDFGLSKAEDQVDKIPGRNSLDTVGYETPSLSAPVEAHLSDNESKEFGGEDAKRKVVPGNSESLDESLTDEQGKTTIHVVRDRELYAYALRNMADTDDDYDSQKYETNLAGNFTDETYLKEDSEPDVTELEASEMKKLNDSDLLEGRVFHRQVDTSENDVDDKINLKDFQGSITEDSSVLGDAVVKIVIHPQESDDLDVSEGTDVHRQADTSDVDVDDKINLTHSQGYRTEDVSLAADTSDNDVDDKINLTHSQGYRTEDVSLAADAVVKIVIHPQESDDLDVSEGTDLHTSDAEGDYDHQKLADEVLSEDVSGTNKKIIPVEELDDSRLSQHDQNTFDDYLDKEAQTRPDFILDDTPLEEENIKMVVHAGELDDSSWLVDENLHTASDGDESFPSGRNLTETEDAQTKGVSLFDEIMQEESMAKKRILLEDSSLLKDEQPPTAYTDMDEAPYSNVDLSSSQRDQYEEHILQEERPAEEMKMVERTVSSALERTISSPLERTLSSATDASLKAGDVDMTVEWQDDDLPRMIGEDGSIIEERRAGDGADGDATVRKVVRSEGLEGGYGDYVEKGDSDSDIDSNMDNEQLEWENDTPVRTRNSLTDEIPQYSAAEERRDTSSWKLVTFADSEFSIDMRAIEPYKKVLSHGGYYGDGLNAIIVFSGCYLPSKERKDYAYIMNHLFYYVIHTLDELVADDYMIVYFHGATPRKQMPGFGWLRKCYQCIDRRLKKNLKALYLVHPTIWLRTVILMTRPFISSKFSSKMQFVRTLDDLKKLIPMDYVYVPEHVQRYDDQHFHPSPPSTSSYDTQVAR